MFVMNKSMKHGMERFFCLREICLFLLSLFLRRRVSEREREEERNFEGEINCIQNVYELKGLLLERGSRVNP